MLGDELLEEIGVDNVNRRIEQVNQVTQQNETTDDMTDTATAQLKDSISQFADLMRKMTKK